MSYEYGGKTTEMFGRLPGFKKLVAWQAASDLAADVNTLAGRFGPPYYGLADQMRRAAIAVSGNLAEGYCSGSLPNYLRYGNIARGSLGELGSYLQDCERWNLLRGAELDRLTHQYSLTTLFLDRLLASLAKKKRPLSPSDEPPFP